jgi:amino acid transporter
MAKAKKFGTFSGVFTPSILTILGVIMYLRFPAIIGQAGLINTIGIIVIAHIISITTSMSVASLSTDKPVQGGGTYFMISRSLGLPIGGTLGLALFVGLSFSVSLYLIGFAESFLQYWGLENNLNTIRITGTIVLIAVTTLTFISTSLAIKSQYFIMAAIVLSLLSIFFGKHEFAPTHVNLAPLATTAPFMVLFGIFFPAVTGFEAGVSMSGDLKNPKKSLPLGAMAAVGVGFIVYLCLALFYAFTVDADALANDPQILFKIALVPGLVIAGIWGATLSSALGSILGAPRILQAIALDKIAPKFLAKGSGNTNEPRNALLVAFFIAEAGILIGSLDVIARIVSMFFITTYGFLNLASAIESWSSSDFRPAFKIPRFVSILGALSAFIVMILLDFLALAGATIVLGLLYFLLQRKELILESGDAWSSFWTNLAKRALLRLTSNRVNKRNWRPNIILFSGGEQARPHLVELGLSLTGKLGALTDFELKTMQHPVHSTFKMDQVQGKGRNYFIRDFQCDSLLDGIHLVSSVYGFSGFEPNTVLMGWSRNIQTAGFLVDVLKDFKSKNLNAVFLDYDKTSGFGKKERIDIWWDGKGRHLSFSLNLLKFLLSDHAWRDARLRILHINSDTSLNESIIRNTNAILTEKRMNADVKVISDDFGSRSRMEIINSESVNADLLILGLSQNKSLITEEYIGMVNTLSRLPASLMLLSPSTDFEEINLVENLKLKTRQLDFIPESIQLPALPALENRVAINRIEKLDADVLAMGSLFIEKTFSNALQNLQALQLNFKESVIQNIANLEEEMVEYGKMGFSKTVAKNHQLYLMTVNNIAGKNNAILLKELKEFLNEGISDLLTRMGNYTFEAPEWVTIPYISNSKGREKEVKYSFRKSLNHYLETLVKPQIKFELDQLEEITLNELEDLRKLIPGINDSYEKLALTQGIEYAESLRGFDQYPAEFKAIEEKLNQFKTMSEASIMKSFRELCISMARDMEELPFLSRSKKKPKIKTEPMAEHLNSFAESFGEGVVLLNNTLFLDTMILSRKNIAKNLLKSGIEKITIQLSDSLLNPMDQLIHFVSEDINNPKADFKTPVFPDKISILAIFNETWARISDLKSEFSEDLAIPESIYGVDGALSFSDYNVFHTNLKKVSKYYMDTLFYEHFYRELQQVEKIINTAIIECKEANSLLIFHLSNVNGTDVPQDLPMDAGTQMYEKLLKQINNEKEKVETAIARMEHYSMTFLQEAYANLFYHSIVDAESKIDSEKREQTGRKFTLVISTRIKALKGSINNLIVYLLNSSSRGMLFSRRYLVEKELAFTNSSQVLDLVEEILPDQRIYNSVPVFYRNLMSSSSTISDEFWVPRNKEFNLLKDAVQRHKRGMGGAALITGEHGAGKTALSRYGASHLFKKRNIFWIDPPVGGSANVNDFLSALQEKLAKLSDFASIFNNIPFESTLVLNNLELWWERRDGGDAVLLKIIELIQLYGNKIFFILNCNTHSFNIIKKIVPLENSCLSIIECGPFNAKELQKLVLSRHKSSGIGLNYHGTPEDAISQLSLSILFNKYFIVTDGNPGVALNSWKANIISSGNDEINIKKPERPNTEVLNNLQPDWLIIIALFIQHKEMDVHKLARITGYLTEHLNNLVVNLKYAGILVQKNEEVYTLGRNIEPLLVEVCLTQGII